MRKNISIIFDLDHTLFDTKLFINDLLDVIKSGGINNNDLEKQFLYFKKKHVYDFSGFEFVNFLKTKTGVKFPEEVQAKAMKFLNS